MARQLLAEQAKREAALLSAWFYDAKFQGAWKPDPEAFNVRGHRAVAEVLAHRGPGLTPDGLVLELRRRDGLKYFEQGAEGVNNLIHGTPATADPWRELEQLRELNALARLRDGLSRALAELDQGKGLADVQNATTDAIRDASTKLGTRAVTVQRMLKTALDRATERDRRPGCTTGHALLDRVTGGIRPREVWVFGADTNWGKSSWLVAVLDENLRAGRRVAIISAEDPLETYGTRLLARRSQANAWRLREAKLTRDEVSAATNVVAEAEDLPCFIDGIGKPAELLASELRSFVLSEGIDLVLVDYVQAMRCTKDFGEKRNLEVAHIARVFTDAIKTSGAGGVLFSQITIDPNKKHPTKHSLRETRDLANAAEVVLLGYSEKGSEWSEKARKEVEVEVRKLFLDKNKNGPKGLHCEMPWNKEWAGFETETRDDEEAA